MEHHPCKVCSTRWRMWSSRPFQDFMILWNTGRSTVHLKSWSACTEITTLGLNFWCKRQTLRPKVQTWLSSWTKLEWTGDGVTKPLKFVSTMSTHCPKSTKSSSLVTLRLIISMRPNKEKAQKKLIGNKKATLKQISKSKQLSWSEEKFRYIPIT